MFNRGDAPKPTFQISPPPTVEMLRKETYRAIISNLVTMLRSEVNLLSLISSAAYLVSVEHDERKLEIRKHEIAQAEKEACERSNAQQAVTK